MDIILIGIIPWFWLDTKEYRRDINIVTNVWIDDLTPCLKDYEEYYKQLEIMPDPIMASNLPKVKLNLKGIRDYARKKGVSIASLSDTEKQLFIKT